MTEQCSKSCPRALRKAICGTKKIFQLVEIGSSPGISTISEDIVLEGNMRKVIRPHLAKADTGLPDWQVEKQEFRKRNHFVPPTKDKIRHKIIAVHGVHILAFSISENNATREYILRSLQTTQSAVQNRSIREGMRS